MSRLLLVSNRLPVTIVESGDELSIHPSMGGLASGLRGVHEELTSLWIGWLGRPLAGDPRAAQLTEALDGLSAIPVELTADEVEGFYHGVSNSVLWPLFHYQIDRLPLEPANWQAYVDANRKFAEAVIANYEAGDLIWVHDYHLFLVPGMIRDRIPNARIGFFLHIPFPSSEVFSLFPWREEVLRGLLGADLIGFHSAGYVRHFSTALRRVLAIEMEVDTIRCHDRRVKLGVFPLGVDNQRLQEIAESSSVRERMDGLQAQHGDARWLLSVDRLDYTKGIPRRLLAFERLLERHPEWRERVRFIQVSAPSREQVASYAAFATEIDELVGRINSRWSTPAWTPLLHLHRPVELDELVALYRSADVMVVTPLRDGMNLVAKEFVATRVDNDGVMVLSEFAGAAGELAGALHVNPYDSDRFAETLHRALLLPPDERHTRMALLRERVLAHSAHSWATEFLDALGNPKQPRVVVHSPNGAYPPLAATDGLALLLDYDGTLVPFAPTPEQAVPDPELLQLLSKLARIGTDVHIISGRAREFLEEHFAETPVGLHAEHGLWSRPRSGGGWFRRHVSASEWKEQVRGYLDHFCRTTPGSFIEEKDESFSWHFRLSDAEFLPGTDFGEFQAKELRLLLAEVLSNVPVHVLVGNRVIEIRPAAINKGLVVPFILGASPRPVIAIGDDTTDEDIFAALDGEAVTIKVGHGETCARYRLQSHIGVREYLKALANELAGSLLRPTGIGITPARYLREGA